MKITPEFACLYKTFPFFFSYGLDRPKHDHRQQRYTAGIYISSTFIVRTISE